MPSFPCDAPSLLFAPLSQLLPWFFLGQTFLLEGQPPTLDLLGIAVGHVYFYAEAEGRLKAPGWLKGMYEEGGGGGGG